MKIVRRPKKGDLLAGADYLNCLNASPLLPDSDSTPPVPPVSTYCSILLPTNCLCLQKEAKHALPCVALTYLSCPFIPPLSNLCIYFQNSVAIVLQPQAVQSVNLFCLDNLNRIELNEKSCSPHLLLIATC